jgi:hypothetical protein
MPTTNRIIYALAEVAIGPYCSVTGLPVHGVQSVSMNTNFNLEQVFELGQLDIYENIENLPTVEMTIDKVLDGYPLVYHLSTRGATSKSLLNRTNQRADVFVSLFQDTNSSATGTPMVQAYCSGMYVNSLNYTLPVQGNARESVSLTGNDKIWKTSSFAFNGHFDNTDTPASGTQRRQNVRMGSGESVFPTNIPGVTVIGGSGYNIQTAGVFGAHIQDVNISCSLGREDLYELGRRKPYYKYATFPTAVNCSITVTAGGSNPGDNINAISDATNLTNEPIKIKLDDGTIFDLGNKNKLQSVSFSGFDATGGNATMTYSFQNFNKLDVTSLSDPEGLT